MRLTSLLSLMCVSAFLLLAGVAATLAEADGPAVSGVNGKLSPFGGGIGAETLDDGAGGIAGSLTLPVAHSFGLQLDGAYARLSDDDFANAGAHLFWRDPDVGLVGLYAGYAWLDESGGQEVGRVGLELQRFIHRITLDGALGYRFGDIDDDLYGRAKLDYYLTDDLMLFAGYSYEGLGFATVGAEYQFASRERVGTALFAEASLNDSSDYGVLGGLRVFLGEDMSLIGRHRRQDPPSYTMQDMLAVAQAAAKAQSRRPGSEPRPVCPVTTCLAPDDPCACPSGYEKRAVCGNTCQVAGGGGCQGWGC
ncbi:porin family protein [Hyphomicrobium sp. CS1GBMeth3]|uniref:porin family protein n=1 Tax=Hyphomicrobium sp. CS1GBMeth3 TaxID=1892845 RepID=UPI000AEA0C07|nr:porin family protein [Hyphomicrobium sp. CS1GBMeth3]